MGSSNTTEAPTYAELRQRVLDGQHVDGDEYLKAKTLAELDELQTLADQQAAARQAEAERRARFDELRTRAQRIVDHQQQRDALAEQVRQAVAEMFRLQADMEAEQGAIIGALLGEGIRAGNEAHGIGWSNADAYTMRDFLRLDDQRVSAGNVKVAIQDALGGALLDVGKQPAYLGGLIATRPR